MKTTYTTHLICAPQLGADVRVGDFLVCSGDQVSADQVLLVLNGPDGYVEISAPEAGCIDRFMVGPDELVETGDLLLTMEVAEEAFGYMGIEETPEYAPACLSAYPLPVESNRPGLLHVDPEAARLAGLLALDLSEVRPGPDGAVDAEAVAAHVRDILIRWRKVKRLLVETD